MNDVLKSSLSLEPEETVDSPRKVITVASYNIHGGVGVDGHFVPNRIIDVLNEMNADVIALQEVESRRTGFDMLAFIARRTRLRAIAGPTLMKAKGDYGNALLTKHRIMDVRRIDLSVGRHEPRGAIDAELDINGASLRVVATHLGLWPSERRQQVKSLLTALQEDRVIPTVFMGDLNEWLFGGRPLRWLRNHFEHTPSAASFPSRWPIFALDRIWAKPRCLLQRVAAHRTPMSRIASDHLPVIGWLEFPPEKCDDDLLE